MKKDLAGWIKTKGLKLPAFAELVGSPYQTVYGYVTGDRAPKAEFLRKAAQVLQISPEDILLSSADELREPDLEYRTYPFLETQPADQLQIILARQVAELKTSTHEQRLKLLDSIRDIVAELKRKYQTP